MATGSSAQGHRKTFKSSDSQDRPVTVEDLSQVLLDAQLEQAQALLVHERDFMKQAILDGWKEVMDNTVASLAESFEKAVEGRTDPVTTIISEMKRNQEQLEGRLDHKIGRSMDDIKTHLTGQIASHLEAFEGRVLDALVELRRDVQDIKNEKAGKGSEEQAHGLPPSGEDSKPQSRPIVMYSSPNTQSGSSSGTRSSLNRQ